MANDVLARSVTATDANNNPNKSLSPGGPGMFPLNYFLMPNGLPGQLPELPLDYSPGADTILSKTIDYETFWAGAVATAVVKMASLKWSVESEVDLRMRRAQEIFHTADSGAGWVTFLEAHLQDYLLTDNGSHIEVVRSSKAVGSKILGLVHLDSLRCRRTGDPDIPVIYTDLLGREHELKDYQVISLSDQKRPRQSYYGVGRCAARRAYNKIREMVAIERFNYEQVTGSRPHGIDFIGGMTQEAINDVLAEYQLAVAQGRGMGASVMGSRILQAFLARDGISSASIEFSRLPEGYDRDKVRSEALLAYALALGIDPQELDPSALPSGLGAGQQSQVLDDKERGKGLASWKAKADYVFNFFVLDEATTFTWSENDLRDKQAKAAITTALTGAISVLAGGVPIVSAEQARQMLVDKDELPKEFINQDLTPLKSLDDNEKDPNPSGADSLVPLKVQPLLLSEGEAS